MVEEGGEEAEKVGVAAEERGLGVVGVGVKEKGGLEEEEGETWEEGEEGEGGRLYKLAGLRR